MCKAHNILTRTCEVSMHNKGFFSKKDKIIFLFIIFYVSIFAVLTWDYFMDDAYIGFTFVRNLKNGDGFVFYPEQNPVEGVTNTGWLFLLLILSPIFSPPFAAKMLGFLFIILSVSILYAINKIFATQYRALFSDILLFMSPSLLLISNFDFLYFSLSGMETAFLSLILLSMALITMEQLNSIILPILGSIAFLIRPEAILVYVFFLLFSFFRKDAQKRKLIYNGLIFGSLILAITLGRYLYFGSLLPNTFTSKQSSLLWIEYNIYHTLILRNTQFPFPFSILFVFIIPILVKGAKHIAKRNYYFAAMSISSLLAGLIFSVYAPKDWTNLGRYFSPYLPFLIFLFWMGIVNVLKDTPFSKEKLALRNKILFIMVAALSVVGIINQYLKLKSEFFLTYPGYVLGSSTLIEPSKWINENLPDDAIIASRRIGVLSYFSEKKIFDYKFGLTEPDISQLIAQSKEGIELGAPEDTTLALIWNDIRPHYILEDEHILLTLAEKSSGSLESFSVYGINYHELKRFNIGHDVYWVLVKQK